MTAKQNVGTTAPDGSLYITLTDGAGNLVNTAASEVTVGTSVVAGGTNTKVLYDNAGVLGEYTVSGSGNVAMTTSPTFTTPILGTPTSGVATNLTGTASGLTAGTVTTNANLTGPITSTGNATAVASQTGTGSTFAMSAGPTFTGTVTHPTPFTLGATSVTSTGTQLNYLAAATGTTGTTSTNVVFSTSPTLVTPALGTPSSGVLSSCSAYPQSALTGLGTGVSTFLATPSSANFASAITDETGTGVVVLGTSPTLTTPNIVGTTAVGNATAGSVGERLDGTAALASVSLTNTTAATVTSVNLTAGDWEVSGIAYFLCGTTTTLNYIRASINTGAAVSTTVGQWASLTYPSTTVPGNGWYIAINVPAQRVNVSGTTTYNLVVDGAFGTSTLSAGGSIHAVRVR